MEDPQGGTPLPATPCLVIRGYFCPQHKVLPPNPVSVASLPLSAAQPLPQHPQTSAHLVPRPRPASLLFPGEPLPTPHLHQVLPQHPMLPLTYSFVIALLSFSSTNFLFHEGRLVSVLFTTVFLEPSMAGRQKELNKRMLCL